MKTKTEKDYIFWQLLLKQVLNYHAPSTRPSNPIRRNYNVPAYHFDA